MKYFANLTGAPEGERGTLYHTNSSQDAISWAKVMSEKYPKAETRVFEEKRELLKTFVAGEELPYTKK
jgi:hypothetical protein